jgi:hypothetical protein
MEKIRKKINFVSFGSSGRKYFSSSHAIMAHD